MSSSGIDSLLNEDWFCQYCQCHSPLSNQNLDTKQKKAKCSESIQIAEYKKDKKTEGFRR